jgi:hypothetical protein
MWLIAQEDLNAFVFSESFKYVVLSPVLKVN